MKPRERLQQNHAESNPLHRVQHPEPQPQRAADDCAGDGRPGPRHPEAHAGRGPQHLAPARGPQADGEHGKDPGVAFGEGGEGPEEGGPEADEEGEDEEGDGPGGGVLRGPEVFPVAAVGGGEEEVLDEDGDEEPLFMGAGLVWLVLERGEGLEREVTMMIFRRAIER